MKKHLALAVAILSLSLTAAAQSYQGLSMKDCIELARARNLALKQQGIDRQSKQLALESSKHQYLPSLSADIGHNYSFGRSRDKTGVTVDRSSMNTTFSISGSMELFTGLRRMHDVKAQKLGLEQATARLQKAQDDLDLRVANLYISLLFQQETIAVLQAQIANTESQKRLSEEMVSVGKWPEGKLLELEAQLSKEKQQLVEQRNAMELARLDLAQALEIEQPESLSIAAPDLDRMLAESSAQLISPEQLYSQSLGLRPAIRAEELGIEVAETNLRSAKSGYLPSLSLSAGYGNGYYYNFGKEYESLNPSFADQWKNNGSYSVGISLSIPIFNAMQTQDRVRSSRLQISSARLQLEQEKKNLYKEIYQAYQNAQAAQSQIEAAAASVSSMAKAFSYAEERFRAGRLSAFELFESNTRYSNSRIDELKAKYDFVYKVAVLNFYRGEPLY